MIEVIPYSNKYHLDFKMLNQEWLQKYNLLEPHDIEILDDPQRMIIQEGGCIFLACDGDKIVGTAGLSKENETEFELIKMSAAPEYRGKGISKILMDHCLTEARKLSARKLFLFSNSQLQTALKLYQKYGFQNVEVTGTSYHTADVKMELYI